MKILLLILVVVAVTLSLFLWDSRKKGSKTEAGKSKNHNHNDQSDPPNSQSSDLFESPEAKRLKQSTAAELDIAVEKLERMSLEEIIKMATDGELI
jgi:FtsZ-interacting cell division protein ZipA